MTEPLTDDEYSVLMIAAEGQSLMPIGRWEKPVERLVSRGLLHSHDRFNNVITPMGRAALAGHEAQVDLGIKQAINGIKAAALAPPKPIEAIPADLGQFLIELAGRFERGEPVNQAGLVDALRRWGKFLVAYDR